MAKKVVLYFAQRSKSPLPKEIDKLNELVAAIDYPGTKAKLSGHASTEGSDRINMTLSKDRAGFIEAYLISMGASLSQIKAKGYGETKPAVKEKGQGAALEKLQAKNRRVEVEFDPGKKPGRDQAYQKYLDKYRKRLEKNIENLKKRLKQAQDGRKRTLAHPKKVPIVLVSWQDEIDQAQSELEDQQRYLKELKAAERKHGNPRKAWNEITKSPTYWDEMIRFQRDAITRTKKRLAEARKELKKAKSDGERTFWEELIDHYEYTIKEQEVELSWRHKDKERAARGDH